MIKTIKTAALVGLLALLMTAAGRAQVPSYGSPVLQRPTYAASFSGLAVPQTGAGDAVCLVGSATKTIYVVRVQFSGFKTTIQPGVVANLVKRTAANSVAGTFTAATIGKMDSSVAAAATAVLNGYTVVSTPAAGGVNLRSQYASFSASTVLSQPPVVWTFDPQNNLSQPVVLRGVLQQLCINFPAAFTTDGPALSADFTWTEQ